MSLFRLLFFCCCCYCNNDVSARSAEAIFDMGRGKVMHIDKFMLDCTDTKVAHYQMYYDNLTVTGSGGKISIDYDAVAEVDIGENLVLTVDIQRCRSKENPDSCIKFAAFKTSLLCALINDRKQFWSTMVTCAKPDVRCPAKKGVYRGRGCKMDMSRFNWFPLGDSYWKLKVQIELDRKPIGCGLCEGKVATYKS